MQAGIAPDLSKSSDPNFVKQHLNEGDLTVSIRLVTGGNTSTIYFVWCLSRDCSMRAEASTDLDDIVSPLIGKRNLESLKGSEHREGFDSILIASVTKQDIATEHKSEGETKPTTAPSSKVIFSKELQTSTLSRSTILRVPMLKTRPSDLAH